MKNEENENFVKKVGMKTLCETYRKVQKLQETMKRLSNMDSLQPEERDTLMERCNELMGFLLSGETTGMICRMRTAKAVPTVLTPQYQPFTHPESRYNPVTHRYWLSEQEINIIKTALGKDNLNEIIPPTSRYIN